MASISVPDLYRQSILAEDLGVEQSRAHAEIQCRRQLSLNHTLAPTGITGEYVPSQLGHGVRSQAGRRDIAQQPEIQANSSRCNAFSMRGYVGSIRELDVNKCWPFPPYLMKRRLDESPDALLPPLKVPRYRYWECSECVENCLCSDSSCKNRIAKQQTDDSIHDRPFGKAESLSKLPRTEDTSLGKVMQNPVLVAVSFDTLQEEEAGLKAGQKMSIDIRSVESSFENDKEISHNGDDVVANSPVKPDDSINDSPFGKAESLSKLPRTEDTSLGKVMQNPVLVAVSFDTLQDKEAGLKAGQKMSIDIRSVQSSFENDKEICHNGDDVVANSPVKPDDSINDSPSINDEANSLTKVPKNKFLGHYLVPMTSDALQEETFLDVEQSTPTAISSGESSFQNDKEVHNGDDVVQNSPAEHLTSEKILDDDHLYSINETITCNATLRPTDSEVNSNAAQSFCTVDKDQVFANHMGSHMKAKSDMSDFTEKAEHHPHFSGTMNSAALCNPVEKIFSENDHQIREEREKEKSIKETQGNNALTSSIADGAYKEVCISEDRQVRAEKEKEKSITETPGNCTFASSIADEDYKEDCIAQGHQVSADKEKEKSLGETPENNTLASSIVDALHKEDSITQVSTIGKKDGILTKIKNHRFKRQKGKGKTLKKRLISDLIAVTPFEQLKCNEVNWNCNIKNMSRKEIAGTPNKDIIGTWGVSKAAVYRSRKFKGNSKYSSGVQEKLDLGCVEIMRKPQCLDGSYQSSASAKFVEEARSTVKRRFRSKKPQRSSEEILSKDSRKHTPENGIERELLKDQDDDVLNDLASFMAKNQYERHAPNPCNLEESECSRVSILQNKNSEAEDVNTVVMEKSQQWSNLIQTHNNNSEPEDINKVVTEKSLRMRDPIQLHENDSLKELVKGRDTSTPQSSIDGQVHLLVEDSPDTNQLQESVMPEKLEMSGPAADEAEVISHTRNAIILNADHCAHKNCEKANRNLDKGINTELVNHKGSLAGASMMKAHNVHNVNGRRPFQRKSTSIKKSIHRFKKIMKSSHDQLSLIEQTNAALNAALHNVGSRSVHVYNSGPDVSVPVGSCKDIQTVVGTSFSPVQTNSAQGFVHTQTVAQPVLAHTVIQMRPTTSNVHPNLANTESPNAKASQLPQTEGSSKGQRADAALAARYNPQERVQQPTMREEDPSLNPVMMPTCKDFTFENTKGNSGQANDNQVTQKPDMHMAQPPAAGVSGPQSTSILTGIPVINFPVEHRPKHLSKSSISQPPSGEILSCFALKGPSSLIAEQTTEVAMCRDQCQPLRSPVILSFALGNKLDTETTLSQEFFDQGKLDLQSYIQKRIQSLHPSQASKSSSNEAVRDSEVKESQSANQNPVDIMDSKNCVANKNQVRFGQNNAALLMNADQNHIKNVKAKQIQADNNSFPPISLPLLQTDGLSRNLNTGLEIADGENYKRDHDTEVSQAPTDNQVTVLGENLHTTLDKRVTNKKQVGYDQNNAVLFMNTDQRRIKNVKAKQVQEVSNTFPQISLPLPDALRRTLNSGLEIADGQNCNRKSSTESSQTPTDNQPSILEENLNDTMENSVSNNNHVRYSQNNTLLFMNTDRHHINNIESEQIQADINTFPRINLPLLQNDAFSRNLDTGLDAADGQNYKRKAGTEASQVLTDNQVTVLGENLHTTLENRVTNKKQVGYGQNYAVLFMNAYQHHIKNVKAKQVQTERNSFPPISPLLQSDALRRNLENTGGQNCNRKGGSEASRVPIDNQATGLGENLNATLENRVTNKNYIRYNQDNAILLMNAGQLHTKNAKVKQVQADGNSFPPINLALHQTAALKGNLDTGLEVARGRNCKRKRSCRLVPTDNQATVPGENLNSTLESRDTEIHIGNKIIRCKLLQVSSQTSKAITMTDALGEGDSMLQRNLRTGKLKSINIATNKPAYIPVGKRHKYVKKTKEAIAQRKLEAQSNCMQTMTCAVETQGNVLNPSLPAVPSTGPEPVKLFAGSQYVLKPIAQNTQQLLPVSLVPFLPDQQEKVATEEILNTVQGSSQTSKPITMAAAPGESDSMLQKALRSGKLMESNNIVNNKPAYIPVAKRRKAVKKTKGKIAQRKLEALSHHIQTETCAAENCTTQGNVLNPSSQDVASRGPDPVKHFYGSQYVPQKKLETESHCIQTGTCAAENYTTQGIVLNPSLQTVASEPVKHCAGSPHVLKPIAQNTQQLLSVPSVPSQADQQDKVAMEERLNTVQVNSQTSKPIAMIDALGGGDSRLQIALRSGNLLESSNILNNMPAYIPVVKRRKYVKKAQKEAEALRKLEAQWHCMQTETCAAENYTTQGFVLNSSLHAMASTGSEPVKHFAGSQDVLKPITQNIQQLLPVPPVPFLVDQQNKVAVEERLNLASPKVSSECSKRKSRGQVPLIPNIFDRAIEDYIKWGIVSVFPPSPQTLPPKAGEPMKLSAGSPLDSRPEHYGKCGNHVFVDTSSTANIAVAPCVGDSNIAIPACTNIMPQQPTVTPEMQAYLDRSKLNFVSFAQADNPVAVSKDFKSEPNMPTESGAI